MILVEGTLQCDSCGARWGVRLEAQTITTGECALVDVLVPHDAPPKGWSVSMWGNNATCPKCLEAGRYRAEFEFDIRLLDPPADDLEQRVHDATGEQDFLTIVRDGVVTLAFFRAAGSLEEARQKACEDLRRAGLHPVEGGE